MAGRIYMRPPFDPDGDFVCRKTFSGLKAGDPFPTEGVGPVRLGELYRGMYIENVPKRKRQLEQVK